MGKCLSCCDDEIDDQPSSSQHNGQTIKATAAGLPQSTSGLLPSSTALSTSHLSVNSSLPPSQSPSQHSAPPVSGGTSDKKMFTPYPKLPPIQKLCHSDASKRHSISEARIQALFDQYKDAEEDCILADGIEALCNDLEVKPDDFKVLALAWNFSAETMCRFSKAEFFGGCKKLHVDSIQGIKAHFDDMVAELTNNRQTFKEFYRWTYKFGLDADTGQRTLPTEMAISLWQLVFHKQPPPILGQWLDFLREHPHIRGIPKDTWDMFLNFTEAVGSDLSAYDDTEAWPSLFDDFVEYENDRRNQNLKSLDLKPNQDAYDY